jgi:hypothetical protein
MTKVSLNDKVFGTDSKRIKQELYFSDIVNLVNGVSGKDFIQYKFLTDYLNTGSLPQILRKQIN